MCLKVVRVADFDHGKFAKGLKQLKNSTRKVRYEIEKLEKFSREDYELTKDRVTGENEEVKSREPKENRG